jgi:hypothetical protein
MVDPTEGGRYSRGKGIRGLGGSRSRRKAGTPDSVAGADSVPIEEAKAGRGC